MNPPLTRDQNPPAHHPHLAAFLDPYGPEVFHSVATPTTIWQADPYDVDTIHSDARGEFERLLHRAGHLPRPPSGAVLVILGEAGSGKTHLLRSFRTRSHEQRLGYCSYLQMTSETNHYPRYMLQNVIDVLEQPYDPYTPSKTGLARISRALLERVDGLEESDRESFRQGEGDSALLVDEFADRLQATDRFQSCDIELLRVILHLERAEPQVRSRALMWLRCENMRSRDTEWIGGAIPRFDEADPLRMLTDIARLIYAIEGDPLVILIDQLEDMAHHTNSVERFIKVVDAILAITDTVPNAIVVLACLEDYFRENLKKLTQSKQVRLERDPEPVRLSINRSLEEIAAMSARRLERLYDEAGVDSIPPSPLFPFQPKHLAKLEGMTARDVLYFLLQHQKKCIQSQQWIEPESLPAAFDRVPPTEIPVPSEPGLDPLWNDFRSSFQPEIPDSEEELATILAEAIRSTSDELSEGLRLESATTSRFVEVAIHQKPNGSNRLLVAVCNKNAQGGGLGKQLDEVKRRLGDRPVALVRCTDFPSNPKSQVVKQIGELIRGDGRRVVIADADWRRMLAFREFQREHDTSADFVEWQRASRPLGSLDSLQKILKLQQLIQSARPSAPVNSSVAEPRPVGGSEEVVAVGGPEPVPVTQDRIVLGKSMNVASSIVAFDPIEFTQHAAFLGGAGSGKTTAALNIIEQLLAQGVPAVLVDRKGDLCRYADSAAWERPLNDERSAARRTLRDKLDIAVYTPGEPNGRPLALSLVPPGFDQLNEADREQFAKYAASALGSMIGFKTSQADSHQRAILAKAIETMASIPGTELTVPALRDLIENQDDALLNAISGGYPSKLYEGLAQRLLTFELNNRLLFQGSERLDIDALLGLGTYARPGRARLSIISTRFLDPTTLDFWVSQLLVAVSRWCARSPKPRLQAVFLFDEADVYLPAGNRQPATKAPMEDLLKRARSAGLGIFLATQSPGDLDYRCRDNVRSWIIGRVKEKTALDKLEPMLASAKGNVLDKIPGQSTGEFHLARESSVVSVRSDESLMKTDQLSESEILVLARQTALSNRRG